MNERLVVLGSDWYWEQDPFHRFTLIRSPLGRTFSAATLGRTRWELQGAHPLTMTWEEHHALLSARRPFHDFQFMREISGQRRYFSVSGEPVFDADGRFRGYRGTTRDITEQWAQRVQLDEARSLLGVAAVLGRFGAWSVDVGTGDLQWTEQARALYELPASASTSFEAAVGVYTPPHRARLLAAYERCVRDGTPYDLELQASTGSGRRRWVRVIGVAVRDPAGRIVRVQGAVQDIDASKAAAEAHRELAERFRSTLDALNDAFAMVDRDWRITYANPAAFELMRLAPEQALGGNFWDLFPATRQSEFEDHYRAAMERGAARRFEAWYAPLQAWLRVSVFPSAQGIGISFSDVTAAVQARRNLQYQNEALEQRVRERTDALQRINEELSSFTLAVAHDLRAPLAGVAGFMRAATERLGGAGRPKGHPFPAPARAGAPPPPDDLSKSAVGAEVVARPAEGDAVPFHPAGRVAERVSVQGLPVPAVDEDDGRARSRLEQIDRLAR